MSGGETITTDPVGLEATILRALEYGEECIISDSRVTAHMGGLNGPEREEWRVGFCRREHLSWEAVRGGLLFTRTAPGEGAECLSDG